MASIDDTTGHIIIDRGTPSSFRFDTTGVANPETYETADELGDIVWTIWVNKEFALPLVVDAENPAIRWMHFTPDHAEQIGNKTRDYELRADFGAGERTMSRSTISVEGFVE